MEIRIKRLAGMRKSEIPPEMEIQKMSVLQIVLGSVLLAAALFLVVVIMLQDKKKRGLSGAIAGGSDTYLGKKGASSSKGKVLSKLTTIVSIAFVLVVVISYLFT